MHFLYRQQVQEKRMLRRLRCVSLALKKYCFWCIEDSWRGRQKNLMRKCLEKRFPWEW